MIKHIITEEVDTFLEKNICELCNEIKIKVEAACLDESRDTLLPYVLNELIEQLREIQKKLD